MPEEDEPASGFEPVEDAADSDAAADGEDVAADEEAGAAPSSLTPVPSPLHAVRESAASATPAAAVSRRVREFRIVDMWSSPFVVPRCGVFG
ncbi:hypothetical protein GCM10020256_37420 [Streptomyces thermocoprophilus]